MPSKPRPTHHIQPTRKHGSCTSMIIYLWRWALRLPRVMWACRGRQGLSFNYFSRGGGQQVQGCNALWRYTPGWVHWLRWCTGGAGVVAGGNGALLALAAAAPLLRRWRALLAVAAASWRQRLRWRRQWMGRRRTCGGARTAPAAALVTPASAPASRLPLP